MSKPRWYAYGLRDGARRGEIVRVRYCHPEHRMIGVDGEASCVPVDVQVSADEHYIKGRRVFRRPALPPITVTTFSADGVAEAIVAPLPQNCTVMIDGVPLLVTDRHFAFSANMPGAYELSIDHWPYLPWQATVTAT